MSDHPIQNTDREIWNARDDNGYGPSIHVTSEGRIGINVGGTVIVRRVVDWHSSQEDLDSVREELRKCKAKLTRHWDDLLAYREELRTQLQKAYQRLDFATADRIAALVGEMKPSDYEKADLKPVAKLDELTAHSQAIGEYDKPDSE